ncbi:asparagine--tRNA ligase [[Mycoplasma] mobile]|uniref:Asparagine--tRNA ligase n=1 Tax=Mycoplasma mobile (strain ATCC 43663 / 163K / NCTC 11711) TaxID=267748 RepID=SYN_MYCM1|nr:asparagine--tRNA ligase [[Mycoplasma] mobile]Q6KHD7.1 RecName: Full=Asparagine--tRNA ligase; AltName: Full=Asparaginyl-tRNA synthetase; Short=AsnRS [Mycoplasma mobile 163K]AAT27993.1 asparaginyl-tRNA synthetase [Mycoplasma mobile 163K]
MTSIKHLLINAKKYDQKEFEIKAWVASNRGNTNIRFVEINDGSTIKNLQVVIKKEIMSFLEVDKIRLGAAIHVKGVLKYTPGMAQEIELNADKFILLKNTDEDFPIQKKETSLEALREIPHLRHRTTTLRAIMLIRSTLALEIHKFYNERGYLWVSSPIITGNDGEGAGESFVVDDESKDFFFNKKATLGVTGQLHAEAYALGFSKVYTFAPTFRAENSNTTKHAAEFWMMEPEVAFFDLKDLIKMSDDMLRQVIKRTVEAHPHEFEFFEKNKPGLLKNLNLFLNNKLSILEYREAIKILEKVKDRFEDKNIFFGKDLATEHEKYLAEKHIQGPVAVINYPKSFKAFYMFQNEDNETVAAYDLLVPGIGEVIGGSKRETRYEKLVQRVKDLKINQEDLQWYLDLRRFGQASSAGFGLGFERLIMYITGTENIRDTIPFPRTPKNMKM